MIEWIDRKQKRAERYRLIFHFGLYVLSLMVGTSADAAAIVCARLETRATSPIKRRRIGFAD